MWRTFAGLLVLVAAGVAVSHWPPARDHGCRRLGNNIGFLYSRGIGVCANPAEAVRRWEAAGWYERAALQGVGEAANNLGSLYANPMRGKPNLVLARSWFKRALHDGIRELAATVSENLRTI